MTIKSLLIGCLAFFTLPLLGVGSQMEIWSDSSGTHYRYFIYDIHIDYPDGIISIKQQNDILWATQQPKSQDVFIIAEDVGAYTGPNIKIQKSRARGIKTIQTSIPLAQYKAKSENVLSSPAIYGLSPLLGLINVCEAHGIRNHNAECSYAIDAYEQRSSRLNHYQITREEVINDLTATMAQVISSQFKEYKEDLIEQLENLKKNYAQQNDAEFIAACRKLRLHLVDAKTVHKLKQWDTIKHGFIFEGASHIGNVTNMHELLGQLGYLKRKTLGIKVTSQPKEYVYGSQSRHATDQECLDNALDFRKIFQEILAKEIKEKDERQKEEQQKLWKQKLQLWAEQQRKLEASPLAAYPLKSPNSDTTFLATAQGQKQLKETAMIDDEPQLKAMAATAIVAQNGTAANTNLMFAQPHSPAMLWPANQAPALIQHPTPYAAFHQAFAYQTAVHPNSSMQDQ